MSMIELPEMMPTLTTEDIEILTHVHHYEPEILEEEEASLDNVDPEAAAQDENSEIAINSND
jgi:hypothetical protein